MNEKIRRPLFVSLSIAYLWISLVLFLIVYYQAAEFLLRSGWRGIASLTIGIGLTIIGLVAVVQIQNRSKWGRNLGIAAFGLLTVNGLFAVYDITDLQGRHSSGLLLVWTVISLRIVGSVVLLAAFIFSDDVKSYFAVETSDMFNDPPPPPLFDD